MDKDNQSPIEKTSLSRDDESDLQRREKWLLITIFAALGVLIPLIAAVHIGFWRPQLEQKSLQELSTIIQLDVAYLEGWMKERRGNLAAFAANAAISQAQAPNRSDPMPAALKIRAENAGPSVKENKCRIDAQEKTRNIKPSQ